MIFQRRFFQATGGGAGTPETRDSIKAKLGLGAFDPAKPYIQEQADGSFASVAAPGSEVVFPTTDAGKAVEIGADGKLAAIDKETFGEKKADWDGTGNIPAASITKASDYILITADATFDGVDLNKGNALYPKAFPLAADADTKLDGWVVEENPKQDISTDYETIVGGVVEWGKRYFITTEKFVLPAGVKGQTMYFFINQDKPQTATFEITEPAGYDPITNEGFMRTGNTSFSLTITEAQTISATI